MISDYNRIFLRLPTEGAFEHKFASHSSFDSSDKIQLCIAPTASLKKSFVIVTLTQAFAGGYVALFCLLICKFLLTMDLQALISVRN